MKQNNKKALTYYVNKTGISYVATSKLKFQVVYKFDDHFEEKITNIPNF